MEYTIREFRTQDMADLARSANHAEIADNLREAFPYPYEFSDARHFVEDVVSGRDPNFICRAICADDAVIGCISLTKGKDVYKKTAELGYFIHPSYWGNGIVLDAVNKMCDEFLDGEEILRVFAAPFATNHASCRVLEKAGFEKEGVLKNGAFKNGVPVDTYVYARVKNGTQD